MTRVVIAAGYEQPMYELLHSNPGLNRDSGEPYTSRIIMQRSNANIQKFSDDNENIVSEEVENKAFQKIKKLVAFKTDTFGNAREIRKLYEDN